MWTLTKRALKKAFRKADAKRDERGSIAVVFAVMLASGVLVGLIGLAFDAGIVYKEQQSLRVSASAAAKGLATKCALGAPQCASQGAAMTLVQTLLNANSADGLSAIDEVCGVSPLNSCVALTTKSQDCKAIAGGTNYVRVTAKTQTPSGTIIGSIFGQLLGGRQNAAKTATVWNCAQATWTGGGGSCMGPPGCSISEPISFNIAVPACSYPGNNNAVVLWKFRNQTNNPNPPREASCSFSSPNGTVNLTDVANGFAPYFANVGACNSPLTLTTGANIVFDDSNLRFYCGGNNSSFETFLTAKIASQQSIRVPLGGTFVKIQPNQWNIKVLGFTDFQFLGYRLSGNQIGGAIPPGGWAAYPPGVTQNSDKCTASRDCFYGRYTSAPTFIPATISVQLVP